MKATVHDVCAYILSNQGEMATMKLHKILYYCQAWSLVWDDNPLFEAEINAWMNGPIIPEVYARHEGTFKVSEWAKGDETTLQQEQKETIDKVLNFYGDKKSYWLSDLVRQEYPWLLARKGVGPSEMRSDLPISLEVMKQFYESL